MEKSLTAITAALSSLKVHGERGRITLRAAIRSVRDIGEASSGELPAFDIDTNIWFSLYFKETNYWELS